VTIAERERAFHNERFSHAVDPRQPLNRWYTTIRHGAERQNRFVLKHCANKEVLEYGCADGSLSLNELRLPTQCLAVTGIDISDVAIGKANARAAEFGYSNAQFFTMDGEAMAFPDCSFDLVFGRGVLHHLDLAKALPELSRVMRQNGVAIFCEPMGHNPIVNMYRKQTPNLRSPDEHPLLMADLAEARRHFARVDTWFYGLFSVANAIVSKGGNGVIYRFLVALDGVVLQLPVMRRWAWYCLIICRKDGRP
jgi:SAM-dependent methyltransferase